jgi:hypothetical protein
MIRMRPGKKVSYLKIIYVIIIERATRLQSNTWHFRDYQTNSHGISIGKKVVKVVKVVQFYRFNLCVFRWFKSCFFSFVADNLAFWPIYRHQTHPLWLCNNCYEKITRKINTDTWIYYTPSLFIVIIYHATSDLARGRNNKLTWSFFFLNVLFYSDHLKVNRTFRLLRIFSKWWWLLILKSYAHGILFSFSNYLVKNNAHTKSFLCREAHFNKKCINLNYIYYIQIPIAP